MLSILDFGDNSCYNVNLKSMYICVRSFQPLYKNIHILAYFISSYTLSLSDLISGFTFNGMHTLKSVFFISTSV